MIRRGEDDSMNFDALDAFLDGLETKGISGCDCLIFRDGALIHRHMTGYADREHGIPVTENTLYRMFSMTKPITCTAMLQLYERGKYLMTDPVSAYLPEFRDIVAAGDEGKADAPPVTMRHLFTMTSGLSYDLESASLRELYSARPGTYTTREFVQAIAKEKLLFTPGTHWCYSLAHDVLAACVEVLSGERFGEYLRTHIFAPLGIEEAWFHVPIDQIHRSCVRYHLRPGTPEFERDEGETDTQRPNTYQRSVGFESGGAGLTMTAEGYARFANMLTLGGVGPGGERILSGRSVGLMRENQLTADQLRDFNWIQMTGYGYGLGVRTLIDRTASGSLGPLGEFGWGGAAGTYFFCDPANRLTLVYAQQASPSEEEYIHPRLRNLVYAGLQD